MPTHDLLRRPESKSAPLRPAGSHQSPTHASLPRSKSSKPSTLSSNTFANASRSGTSSSGFGNYPTPKNSSAATTATQRLTRATTGTERTDSQELIVAKLVDFAEQLATKTWELAGELSEGTALRAKMDGPEYPDFVVYERERERIKRENEEERETDDVISSSDHPPSTGPSSASTKPPSSKHTPTPIERRSSKWAVKFSSDAQDLGSARRSSQMIGSTSEALMSEHKSKSTLMESASGAQMGERRKSNLFEMAASRRASFGASKAENQEVSSARVGSPVKPGLTRGSTNASRLAMEAKMKAAKKARMEENRLLDMQQKMERDKELLAIYSILEEKRVEYHQSVVTEILNKNSKSRVRRAEILAKHEKLAQLQQETKERERLAAVTKLRERANKYTLHKHKQEENKDTSLFKQYAAAPLLKASDETLDSSAGGGGPNGSTIVDPKISMLGACTALTAIAIMSRRSSLNPTKKPPPMSAGSRHSSARSQRKSKPSSSKATRHLVIELQGDTELKWDKHHEKYAIMADAAFRRKKATHKLLKLPHNKPLHLLTPKHTPPSAATAAATTFSSNDAAAPDSRPETREAAESVFAAMGAGARTISALEPDEWIESNPIAIRPPSASLSPPPPPPVASQEKDAPLPPLAPLPKRALSVSAPVVVVGAAAAVRSNSTTDSLHLFLPVADTRPKHASPAISVYDAYDERDPKEMQRLRANIVSASRRASLQPLMMMPGNNEGVEEGSGMGSVVEVSSGATQGQFAGRAAMAEVTVVKSVVKEVAPEMLEKRNPSLVQFSESIGFSVAFSAEEGRDAMAAIPVTAEHVSGKRSIVPLRMEDLLQPVELPGRQGVQQDDASVEELVHVKEAKQRGITKWKNTLFY
ncbi:hypothetical protein HDU98_000376 [Podochytrium sp. JEL0797]|nr:hypothetical protein HDU98_000376 [Podochytrium sp. JEL0797]